MQEQLSNHDWIALDIPTIADVALYPYIALAHEGKVDLSRFPSVVAWLTRFKALPGYVSMPESNITFTSIITFIHIGKLA